MASTDFTWRGLVFGMWVQVPEGTEAPAAQVVMPKLEVKTKVQEETADSHPNGSPHAKEATPMASKLSAESPE
jgi:hypothetical protein